MDLALQPTADTAAPPPATLAAAIEPEQVYGCGWFDSSLDLAHGLRVVEHSGHGWLAELPLGAWLQ